MLAEVSDEYVFKTLSQAKVAEEKAKPKRALIAILGFMLGGMLAVYCQMSLTRIFVDNLNKAEKLGALSSTEKWLTVRQLRNQIIHEYIEEYTVLAEALQSAHQSLDFIREFAENILKDLDLRT